MPAVSVEQAFCIKGYLSAICGPPLMLDCVIMDSITRIIVCQKFSLILSGKSLKESCYLIYLGRSQLYSTLIDTHIADSIHYSLNLFNTTLHRLRVKITAAAGEKSSIVLSRIMDLEPSYTQSSKG